MTAGLAPAFEEDGDVLDGLDGSLDAAELPKPSLLEQPDEILTALRALEAEESRIDDELSAVMADRAMLETLLDRVDSVRPVVEQVQLEAGELARRIDDTADVAERISGKVRQLDLEQSRVMESIEMVQAVQDLRTSLAALAASVDRRDWETATRNFQRATGVDKAITTSAFAESVVPTGELPLPPAQAIADFRTSLLQTFLREFEKASSERDEANTSRYFKLFPMISAEQEGLQAYATFVTSIVSGRSRGALQQQASSPTYFASLMTPLFEQIALIISQHQPVVEKYYGTGKMVIVAEKLQEECDQQANGILRQWAEERRTSRKIQETQRYRYPHLANLSASQSTPQAAGVAALKRPYQQLSRQATQSNVQPAGSEEEAIDPREIDALLSELAQISGRWELYRRFMYARLTTDEEDTGPSRHRLVESPTAFGSPGTELGLRTPTAGSTAMLPNDTGGTSSSPTRSLPMIEQSPFRNALHRELLTVYEPLELWYLRSSVEKAHHLDEADFENMPYLSSALDDAFFILKKVLQRVVAVSAAETHERMCAEVKSILDKDFALILKRRMDGVWAGITSTAQSARMKEEATARQSFIVYANDLDVAAEYVVRVVEEQLDSDALSQSYFMQSEYEEARKALEDVRDLQERFRSILKSGLDQLFNQLIRPRMRGFLSECYRDITYMLDEDGYNEAEYQDTFRKRFSKGWDALMEPYRETFTSNNYQFIFTLAVGVLGRLWENQLKAMKFGSPNGSATTGDGDEFAGENFGALRLDKDLRAVTSFLSNQTPYGVSVLRDSFARLQQISMLLSVETASDTEDLASGTGWKLSQQETKTFLALKV